MIAAADVSAAAAVAGSAPGYVGKAAAVATLHSQLLSLLEAYPRSEEQDLLWLVHAGGDIVRRDVDALDGASVNVLKASVSEKRILRAAYQATEGGVTFGDLCHRLGDIKRWQGSVAYGIGEEGEGEVEVAVEAVVWEDVWW